MDASLRKRRVTPDIGDEQVEPADVVSDSLVTDQAQTGLLQQLDVEPPTEHAARPTLETGQLAGQAGQVPIEESRALRMPRVGTVGLVALVRFKDLCIDATDVSLMAEFWGQVLGLDAVATANGARLDGETPEQTIWINRVSEPKSVKHRVHLDVHAARDDIPGATPISAPGEFRWRVMADPEGGEFCVFQRVEVPAYRLYEVIVDSHDCAAQTAWWGEVFGATPRHGGEDFQWLEDVPGMPFECLVFGDVPEPKTVKNRIHWDVEVDDRDALDDLLRRGATVLREPDDDIDWFVLADPEGNEFCVFGA